MVGFDGSILRRQFKGSQRGSRFQFRPGTLKIANPILLIKFFRMNGQYSVAAHWPGDFDEAGLQKWAEELRGRLDVARISLGLLFMAPKFFKHASQVLEIVRVHARVPLLVGCSSHSLIAGSDEIEEDAGLVLGLYYLPDAVLTPFYFSQQQLDEASGATYWHTETDIAPEETNGWL